MNTIAVTVPRTLPEAFRRIEWAYRRPRWKRMTQIALLLAAEGVSTASELIRLLAVNKKSLHVALDSMLDLLEPLIESRIISIGSLGRMRIVTLTDHGKALARALGVEPVESDWEKIVRFHRGETQERHAALVLMAAYQARLRGWKAEVMPFDSQ